MSQFRLLGSLVSFTQTHQLRLLQVRILGDVRCFYKYFRYGNDIYMDTYE